MKIRRISAWIVETMMAVAAVMLAAACANEKLPQGSEPVQNGDFVRLHLSCGRAELERQGTASEGQSTASGGQSTASGRQGAETRAVWEDELGSGALSFKWEAVEANSEDVDKLSLIISDGSRPIPTWKGPFSTSDENATAHTGLTVSPHEEDNNSADFQTVRYYSSAYLEQASYCCAVAGMAQISNNEESGSHIFHLDMPQTFTQSASQDPSFLRDYMQMYAASPYSTNGTSLNFTHIPATIRFIISNTGSASKTIEEVSVSVSSLSPGEGTTTASVGGTAIASAASEVSFNWENGTAELSYGANSSNSSSGNVGSGSTNSGDASQSAASVYDKVTTLLAGEGCTISNGGKYVAYTLVLPLENADAFKGKILNFNVKTGTNEYTRFQLDAERLASANGNGIYNWVGGKSYTVKVNLGSSAQVSGEIHVENTIKVSANISGTYTLLYEDGNRQPLENYTEICTLTVDEMQSYEDFIKENVAPREAELIGIYDASGERLGSISIEQFKPSYTDPVYSFGLLSDVHCQSGGSAEPVSDFQRALTFYKDRNVSLTCICGDISQDGTEAEFGMYKNVADQFSSFFPIYTTIGNHDATSAGISEDIWRQYTGESMVFEKSITHSDNTVDHFLFLGMMRWNFLNAYYDHHIAWLESKLEEYRNERCFVITHLFFPDRAGNMNGVYPEGNWLKGRQLTRLQSLCDNYVNSVWFSGHSHWKWYLQKYQDRANIFRAYQAGTPASGWCVHVPSCANPIDSDGSSRVSKNKESEGALVNVYKDHIDILGIDFTSVKYLPIASYRLDTELRELPTRELEGLNYLSASDFVVNPNKVSGATVKDAEGMPDYVEVTFTQTSQGFYVTNDTFVSKETSSTEKTSQVYINIEDVEAFQQDSNGQWISYPNSNLVYVGFYGNYKTYHMASTKEGAVDLTNGLQFQTSSSYTGALPLKIRMKASLQFLQ